MKPTNGRGKPRPTFHMVLTNPFIILAGALLLAALAILLAGDHPAGTGGIWL